MNRRKTIARRWSLRRLFGRPGNRRLRSAKKEATEQVESRSASTPLDLRGLLATVLRVALLSAKVVVVLVLLGGALFGGYHTYKRVMRSTYFNVTKIEVCSTRRAPTDQIRRLVESARGKNILTLDMESLRQMVLAHPWVREATVERELPDTLRVEVTEHRARALLMMGHLYLVNGEGQVFKRAEPDECVGMPVMTGISRMTYLNSPALAARRIAKGLEALDRYYDSVRPPLSEVHVGGQGEITLHLERGGIAVRMGEGVTEERLKKMDAVWAALGPEVRRARAIFLDNVARRDRVTVRMGQYQ